MGDVNSITITGNVGRDAETRAIASGNTVTGFSVANSQYRGGENVTVWYNVTLWGKRGESLAQYITKGTKVAVTGRHFIREYESNGETRQSNDIEANDVALIGGKRDEGEAPRASGGARPAQGSSRPDGAKPRNAPQPIETDDDIPF